MGSATINIDWLDFRYQYRNSGLIGATDLYLKIYDITNIFNTNSVKFQWLSCDGCGTTQEISVFGTTPLETPGTIQVYKQYHRYDLTLQQWVGYNLNNQYPPSRGNSLSDDNYLIYPLDGRNLPSSPFPRGNSAFTNLSVVYVSCGAPCGSIQY